MVRFRNLNFTHTGTWYDLFSTDSINITSLPRVLKPAQANSKFFTDKEQVNTEVDLVATFEPIVVSNPANLTLPPT
jgi:hypothetical protein